MAEPVQRSYNSHSILEVKETAQLQHCIELALNIDPQFLEDYIANQLTIAKCNNALSVSYSEHSSRV
jgi:hypothetical protein